MKMLKDALASLIKANSDAMDICTLCLHLCYSLDQKNINMFMLAVTGPTDK